MREVGDVDALTALDAQTTVVLLGSPPCQHCPEAKRVVTELAELFGYVPVYTNVHDAPDVAEHYEVTQLPALVVKGVAHEAVRGETAVKALLASNFVASLPTDGEF